MRSQRGSVAQLNRASDYGSEGCGFESRRNHEMQRMASKVNTFARYFFCEFLRHNQRGVEGSLWPCRGFLGVRLGLPCRLLQPDSNRADTTQNQLNENILLLSYFLTYGC